MIAKNVLKTKKLKSKKHFQLIVAVFTLALSLCVIYTGITLLWVNGTEEKVYTVANITYREQGLVDTCPTHRVEVQNENGEILYLEPAFFGHKKVSRKVERLEIGKQYTIKHNRTEMIYDIILPHAKEVPKFSFGSFVFVILTVGGIVFVVWEERKAARKRRKSS